MHIEATPHGRAAELAVDIYSRVLDAVRGDRLVEKAMSLDGDRLVIQDHSYDLNAYRRTIVIAIGKAASAMAQGARLTLGERITQGLVITKYGHADPDLPWETIEAGHPIPDEYSLQAGERILALAKDLRADDFVLILLSGGASALMESLHEGLSLDDLRTTNEVLLASGVEIGVINSVRASLSRLKAGGLARALGDSTVAVLILSDVLGNSLATIGSGPFVAPGALPEIPYDIIDRLPPAVKTEIVSAGLIARSTPPIPHFVVGSVTLAVHAAIDAARSLGLEPLAFQDPLRGEAAEMTRKIIRVAKRKGFDHPFCLILGGETTVTLSGSNTGKGGRCQEMAVAATVSLSQLPNCAFLAAGTDGTDGPTDAAGGLVDSGTRARAAAVSLISRTSLAHHDSYRFLEATGGLLRTGPTGSNVNDISLFIYA